MQRPRSAAAGVWTGATSAGEDAGFVQGTADTDGGTFSSSNGTNFAIPQFTETTGFAIPATVSGSYMPNVSLNLTLVDRRGTRTMNATYNPGSDQPASFTAVAGAYSGFSGHISGRQSAVLGSKP